MNTYYKILNEIASTFNMDQWNDQINTFTDAINEQLNAFVHNTENRYIYILECWEIHVFPQFDFYKERCYVNGEKVKLDKYGITKNKWKDQKTVNVVIKDLDQLGKSCERMFYACKTLVSVPQFDTSKVRNMEAMFIHCSSLESVPKFDTNRVSYMNYMFFGCDSLSEKTIQDWSSVYDFTINNKK